MVYFELSVSLDGFVAGPSVTADNPLGDGGERLHDWMLHSHRFPVPAPPPRYSQALLQQRLPSGTDGV